MSEATDVLEREIAAFEAQIEELEKHHKGKFALFKDGKLDDAFTSDREAYEEGLRRYGAQVFLVRRVLKQTEPVSAPALFAGVIDARP